MKKLLVSILAFAAIFVVNTATAAPIAFNSTTVAPQCKPSQVYLSNVYIETEMNHSFAFYDVNTIEVAKIKDSSGTRKEITCYRSNGEHYVFIYDKALSDKRETYARLKPFTDPNNKSITYKGSITYTKYTISMDLDIYVDGVFLKSIHTIGES